jgi:hypothetical protein
MLLAFQVIRVVKVGRRGIYGAKDARRFGTSRAKAVTVGWMFASASIFARERSRLLQSRPANSEPRMLFAVFDWLGGGKALGVSASVPVVGDWAALGTASASKKGLLPENAAA